MEYSKEQVLSMKGVIKHLAAQQKNLKGQRKTEKFIGIRTTPAWKATQQHLLNRYDLRHLYIAYGFMRGKTIEQIEPNRKSEFNGQKIEKILKSYEETVCAVA